MPRGVSFSDIFFNLLGSQSAGDKTGRRVTKKKKMLFDRLASLSIMGAQMKVLLKPLNTILF